MSFIAFGDLEINYYIRDNLLNSITIGNTSLLTLINLKKESTYISFSGNDNQSSIALNILSKLNIMSINKINQKHTKILFIKPKNITNICPYCDRTKVYESDIDINYILDNINDEKLIIDNLYEDTIEILNNINNETYLILKDIDSIKYYNYDELINIPNLELVYLNEKVSQYLIKKYNIDELDILKMFNCKLLIINKGKKGIEFISNDIIYEKELTLEREIIDSSGSEEALFASIINIYLDNNKEINEKILSLMFIKGESIYRIVTSKIGATSHILPNNVLVGYNECICTDIKVK